MSDLNLPVKPRNLASLRSGLKALLVVAPSLLCPGAIGPVEISVENGRPNLAWPNNPGEVYVIESTTALADSPWRQRVIITTGNPVGSWADDALPVDVVFYRVAVAPDPAAAQSLQQALERACVNQKIVGASAAARLPNEGLWLGTYGTSDGAVPIRPQTLFEIGSVTKTFVATTVLRLVEMGRLTLEDTVGQWLPQLNSSNISPTITVRQLLAHRSGVYNFGDNPDFRQALFADWSRRWTPEDDVIYVMEPYFPPGSGGIYSNTGYVLLGMMIRAATGSTVTEEMRRTILDRAGLSNTALGGEEGWEGQLADPHLDFNRDGVHENLGDRSQTAILTSFWTSGAEISTPADVVRFGVSLFEGGLLEPASLAAMRDFRSVDIGGALYDYGLGLMRFDILGAEYWAHSGGLFGEYAWLSYCPSAGVCLAVAYNHPVTRAGPNLPGELLIALSTYPNLEPSPSLSPMSYEGRSADPLWGLTPFPSP